MPPVDDDDGARHFDPAQVEELVRLTELDRGGIFGRALDDRDTVADGRHHAGPARSELLGRKRVGEERLGLDRTGDDDHQQHDEAKHAASSERISIAHARTHHSITSSDTACRGNGSRNDARPWSTFTIGGPFIATRLLACSSCVYWAGVGAAGDPIRCQAV